ncbi:MAG: choice-of-anchor X domain-containing protein [Polyangiales bacterium]
MRERRVVGFVIGGMLLAIAVLIYFTRASSSLATLPEGSASSPPIGAAGPSVVSVASASGSVVAPPGRDPAHVVGATGARGDEEGTTEEKYRARMAETRAALMTKLHYPTGSSPLTGKSDLLLPHHVEPTYRGLSGNRDGKVLIEQRQDRLYLSPGQTAVAMIYATAGKAPVAIQVTRSEMQREPADGGPPPVVGTVTFHDDGVAPDEISGDGISSGLVTPPTDGIPGSLTLFVDLQANGEKGTLNFQFVMTAPPPATFTQTARDALEDGSIAFYVGINVQKAGLYEIVGRVYDAHGGAIAYLRYMDQLTTDAKEVRLLAFGKLLIDEGAVPPLYLRDVEGHRMVIGDYPDRELMADWLGPYKSANYDVKQLSDKDYDGPDKQQRINALNQAEQDGLANIHGGNPLPPGAPLPTPLPTPDPSPSTSH